MGEIITVVGAIESDELGFTSMHEHILKDSSEFLRRRYEYFFADDMPVKEDDPVSLENIGFLRHSPIMAMDNLRLDDEDVMAAEVADFKASGGNAIVEMSVPGLRSNIAGIKRISEKTGVHIVASTGLYTEDSWPEQYRNMAVDQYVQYMRKEIEEGIEDTDIKAGHLKVAFAEKPSEQGEMLLRAVARVSNETGLPVTVHTGEEFVPDDVRRIATVLLEEEINPGRVVMAHSSYFVVPVDLYSLALSPESWGLKLDYVHELLDQGFNIGIDTFGHIYDGEVIGLMSITDWQRLAYLVALVTGGYSSQIVLGTDVFLKTLTRRFGGEGYSRLPNSIVPAMRRLDIDESDIQRITIENPARLLAREH